MATFYLSARRNDDNENIGRESQNDNDENDKMMAGAPTSLLKIRRLGSNRKEPIKMS